MQLNLRVMKQKMSRLTHNITHQYKKKYKKEKEKRETLSQAIIEYQKIVDEQNKEIKNLKTELRCLKDNIDELEDEVLFACESDEKHQKAINELTQQLQELSEQQISSTFSSRRYNSWVRELYYSLSMKIPPGKIQPIICNVLAHFNFDVDSIQLPSRSCAAYMRSSEMPTICQFHKANELKNAKEWHLNSDGTTLNQQKKIALIINGLVFGIHDVADGSSRCILDALKSELDKLNKETEEELGLERIVSCTGDGASTQLKFNKLLKAETGRELVENKCAMHLGVNLRAAQVKAMSTCKFSCKLFPIVEEDKNCVGDEQEINEMTHEKLLDDVADEVKEMSSGLATDGEPYQNDDRTMHNSLDEWEYDVEYSGSEITDDDESDIMEADATSEGQIVDDENQEKEKSKRRDHADIDTCVHEICKLFGHVGTPEYCHGASSFRVFVAKEIAHGHQVDYYPSVQLVHLKCQIGSRYYVTSYNAGRIFFLRKGMLAFLEEQKFVKRLNKLEFACLQKLNDIVLLIKLRLEGLLFDKVYGDLMILIKSKEMNKSALSMTAHYEELLKFFEHLAAFPRLILDSEFSVFSSEPRLYSESVKLNHRIEVPYVAVRKELYEPVHGVSSNEALLLELTGAVAQAMRNKISSYKRDHLPGGRYFSPDETTESILSALPAHNDIAESVFGSNDWLTSTVPNMQQATRSVMIEFSYNKIMEWLKGQTTGQKELLISLAQSRRREFEKEKKYKSANLLKQKITSRIEALEKGKLRYEKTFQLMQELKSEHLIASTDELSSLTSRINSLSLSPVLKENELRSLVKRQIKIRRCLYHQTIKLSMTQDGKQKSLNEILKDLGALIQANPISVRVRRAQPAHQELTEIFKKPSLLVGAKFKHRFDVDNELVWFTGHILKYLRSKYTLNYENGEQVIFTNNEIKEDFFNGDFYII